MTNKTTNELKDRNNAARLGTIVGAGGHIVGHQSSRVLGIIKLAWNIPTSSRLTFSCYVLLFPAIEKQFWSHHTSEEHDDSGCQPHHRETGQDYYLAL